MVNSNLLTLNETDFYEKHETADGIRIAIRQEAVKWLKHLESNDSYTLNLSNDLSCVYHGLVHHDKIITISFIKHFFNITEQDLK